MEYPRLCYVLLVTWDHPHPDNGVGARGAELLVKTLTEGQRVFLQ